MGERVTQERTTRVRAHNKTFHLPSEQHIRTLSHNERPQTPEAGIRVRLAFSDLYQIRSYNYFGRQMNKSDCDYTIYRISGLPAGVFGEAYVVCAAYSRPNDVVRGEWYILTQRPTEELHHGMIDVSGKGLPPELGVVDVNFAAAEALSQARVDLLDLLEKRAKQVNREDIAYLPFDFKNAQSPLLGCWMRGRFTSQLTKIKDITGAPDLHKYLSLLQQVTYTRRPG
jgi:hypothetical protein